ncbi:MbeD family mobilization/exclusion protein [Streptomyces caniscabiei]|uniref:MbeD family mobilization/exclusion protein n=1 Tax=Streptomyces caniscabiei TaxID=2746961 RepID=A0ABU4MYZ9_9ACTN|nr:MbeD family mobilization/exclusion protein [Streptomyces caniscabiei]MDX3015196.1 MbeD family mobilization/exclusion protein [Streptomyces caniscabiei]MDX3042639.1 MbeD family mobilization/exclusion protein [Streptomyces caniscabiei]
MNGIWGIVGAAITVLGVVITGFFTYRGTRTAAAIQAAPQADATKFAVLEATVNRVDKENGQLRERVSRLESLVRAFSRSADRWTRQMHRSGIDPEPADPLVDEYNRTGV